MCLRPLNIINPTRYVSLYQAQLMKMQVRCNKCAECLQAIQSEWYFRSYYHTRACLINGGYMLMDTLTYRNEDLPHISKFVDIKKYDIADFMCFDFKHIRDFIKLLRVRLGRAGYRKRNVFTYFITSEYGTDENCTHRPHYHILFFVNDVSLHPLVLSQMISDCWPYGRTDGIAYKPRLYVLNHVYGWRSNDDIAAITKVTNYVSKYVTKDSKFQKTLDKRLFSCKCQMSEDDYNTLYRQMSMFHRQSQGFGLDYLNIITSFEYDDMLNTMEMQMPDSKKVYKRIPLPTYYRRKLFYAQGKEIIYPELILREQGEKVVKKYWYLTEYGKEHRKKFIKMNIDKLTDNLYSLSLNMDSAEQHFLYKLLDGRSLRDYSVYKLLFCGRFKNGYSIFDEDSMINHIVDYDTPYIDDNKLYRFKSKYPIVENKDIITDKDINYIIHYEESLYKRGSKWRGYNLNLPGYEIHQLGDFYYTDNYINNNTYNENSCLAFRHFDLLTILIEKVNKRLKAHVQQTYDFKVEQKQRYKAMKGGVF